MERKTIKIKITGGEFSFAERNKKDVDFNSLQEKVRSKRFKFIQETVKDTDVQTAMLMSEIEKVYSPSAISNLIFTDKEEQIKFLYDSFKINNPNVNLEAFKNLIADEEIEKVMGMIYEMENESVTEKNNAYNDFIKENEEIKLSEFAESLSVTELQTLSGIVYRQVKKKKA